MIEIMMTEPIIMAMITGHLGVVSYLTDRRRDVSMNSLLAIRLGHAIIPAGKSIFHSIHIGRNALTLQQRHESCHYSRRGQIDGGGDSSRRNEG